MDLMGTRLSSGGSELADSRTHTPNMGMKNDSGGGLQEWFLRCMPRVSLGVLRHFGCSCS